MIRDSKPLPPEANTAVCSDHAAVAREVFRIEAEAIAALEANLDGRFNKAVEAMLATAGRVIVCGMGKSGIIGKKIASTLASTGTPSFFMHPGEAFHGDLGMVTAEDLFVAISNSGETEELVKLLPFLRENDNTVIALTGNPDSTLAKHSNLHLLVRVEREACPLQLAPTASTTATLAMGDALAVALMKARDFQAHHFARFHPGGSLGRRLLQRVRDEMRCDNLPFISPEASADQVLATVTDSGLGVALVSQKDGQVVGVVTDGDLRRAVQKHRQAFFSRTAADLMTINPVTIRVDSNMHMAIELMAEHQITLLVVVDGERVVGVVQK
ncbi:MAG: KpsF/GutQ family sugar-phosphate isomerase [Lamprobacter sp.]|uniref:KpsF/GutQ family sugar-phosphate isomerase n=1 Tax=Lamprobacter sp. TaxID=3100796 RepID=UPI002B26001A|nr:KpsF/GutQ family sugar-phosphate isomerase [Lamprobacter sp.]MEA3638342.1 KpsF/GutQ family sugar-phosphate isomerase [Lamprobacter sp.]